ncbi:MAG: SIS domain-containing protein [Mycobacterium sp.]
MADEIREQPAAWGRLLTTGRPAIAQVAAKIIEYQPRFVLFVARGTSDHAALYGKYLTEIIWQVPAGLASPSTMTTYGARPDLSGVLVIGVSQSGGSPDLVQTLSVARQQGAMTVAVTNASQSPLAAAAEYHVDVLAGPELAVAATKSYTAQLLALYLLLTDVAGRDNSLADLLPERGEEVLHSSVVQQLATRYRFATRLVTTGRGYSYPTAREAALKLMETSYLSAQAFSGADLLHGPLAMIDPQVPVIAIVPDGVGGRAMDDVLQRLAGRGADVCCIGSADAVAATGLGVTLEPAAEELSPLLTILPLQMLALQLAIGRGENPDVPRGLSKVTETL